MKRIIFIIAFCTVFFCEQAFAQQGAFRIEGTVYDETGETLPSVSIYIKNKITIGTSSDADGKFSIRASRGDVLVFSYIGYENEEYLATEAKSDLEIRFTKSAVELDEVMVTALGTQRKISTVAAITSVDVADLQTPVTSVQNLLGGRVAGVISMQTSGEPGKNIADFWIRGIGTFGYNSGALVLVDGLEGDLNSLDPADIESFSILKDASATAVYGVRGANGVVLVATKKGTEGKLTITGRVNYTLSHLVRVPEYLRAYDYALLANEAAVLRNESPIYSVRELDIIQDGTDRDIYPDVSWQDEILNRNFFRKSFYLSARGGATAAKYFISLGGSNETAAYKVEKNSPYASNVGYNTYTYRANIDLQCKHSANAVYFKIVVPPIFAEKKRMFSLNENHGYYLCTVGTDMRKGFNTLMGLVTNVRGQGLLDGSVYVFVNKTRTTLKLLHWERGGFVIYHKRMECGRISQWIFDREASFRSIRWDELVLLMEGINPNTKRRKRYTK